MTDEELLHAYGVGGAAAVPVPAAETPRQPGVVFAAPHAPSKPSMSDEELLGLYSTSPVAAAPAPAPAQAQSAISKPSDGKPPRAPSQLQAALSGFLEGVPIAGPYLKDAAVQGGALARQLVYGDPTAKTAATGYSDIARSEAAYPKTTMAGNVTGGVVSMGGLGATGAGARALGIVGPSLIARAGAGTMTGGAIGATDSAARQYEATGEVDPEKVKNSALVGALFGGAAPGIGSAAGAIANRAGDVVNRFRPAVQAENAIASDIAASHAPLDEMQARMAANPRLAPMDVNPVLQSRAMGLASIGDGTSRPIMMDAYANRVGGAQNAVEGAYDVAMGPTPDVHQLLTGMQETARRNAAQGFGQALENAGPVNVNPVIEAIDRRLYPGGVPDREQMAQLGHGDTERALLRVRNQLANGGNPAGGAWRPEEGGQVFDANRLHEIQSALRREAETLGSSSSGQERHTAGALRDVRQNLITQIDQAAGGAYRPAQRQFADDMAVQDAFHQGMNVFRNRTGTTGLEDRPEYFRQWVQDATPAEREAAVQGARVAVDGHVRGTRFAARKGTDLPEAPANFEKLQALLGPEEADRLRRTMQDERAIAATNNALFQNSLTAPRQEAVKSVAVRPVAPFQYGGISLPVMAEVAGLGHGTAAAGLAAGLAGGGLRTATSAVGRQMDMARNAAMARMLSASGEQGREAMAAIGRRAANNGQLTDEASRRLASALMSGAMPYTPYGALPVRNGFR